MPSSATTVHMRSFNERAESAARRTAESDLVTRSNAVAGEDVAYIHARFKVALRDGQLVVMCSGCAPWPAVVRWEVGGVRCEV